MTLTFAAVTCLTNDERTRNFLSIEIGYGHAELVSLVESINAVLAEKKLPVYYDEARFHASVAWWLPKIGIDMVPSQDMLDALDVSTLRQVKMEVSKVELKIGKSVINVPLSWV